MPHIASYVKSRLLNQRIRTVVMLAIENNGTKTRQSSQFLKSEFLSECILENEVVQTDVNVRARRDGNVPSTVGFSINRVVARLYSSILLEIDSRWLDHETV